MQQTRALWGRLGVLPRISVFMAAVMLVLLPIGAFVERDNIWLLVMLLGAQWFNTAALVRRASSGTCRARGISRRPREAE